jgi:hypothetical protein
MLLNLNVTVSEVALYRIIINLINNYTAIIGILFTLNTLCVGIKFQLYHNNTQDAHI